MFALIKESCKMKSDEQEKTVAGTMKKRPNDPVTKKVARLIFSGLEGLFRTEGFCPSGPGSLKS